MASASVSMSPAAAASMLLGASVALMLCGSVTFAIGFFLMPWVAGLALLFGFADALNTLSSGLFLCTNTKQPPAAAAAAVPCKHPRGRIIGPPTKTLVMRSEAGFSSGDVGFPGNARRKTESPRG
ncbi:uncharacterized protein LOC8068713 [Sorghum bicolor]|uniref:uncharacterized protein LOC8068713 n=1 Tax=Sorghum bicolor TaxID=4558 RepID=UPI000B42478D|nr:uncharacterized protein LOC8068713 [Sorghum bicolor]|eukprot:XP_002452284.2 uncharacterized protein LOC8068713 [Sorghum bicolor]